MKEMVKMKSKKLTIILFLCSLILASIGIYGIASTKNNVYDDVNATQTDAEIVERIKERMEQKEQLIMETGAHFNSFFDKDKNPNEPVMLEMYLTQNADLAVSSQEQYAYDNDEIDIIGGMSHTQGIVTLNNVEMFSVDNLTHNNEPSNKMLNKLLIQMYQLDTVVLLENEIVISEFTANLLNVQAGAELIISSNNFDVTVKVKEIVSAQDLYSDYVEKEIFDSTMKNFPFVYMNEELEEKMRNAASENSEVEGFSNYTHKKIFFEDDQSAQNFIEKIRKYL